MAQCPIPKCPYGKVPFGGSKTVANAKQVSDVAIALRALNDSLECDQEIARLAANGLEIAHRMHDYGHRLPGAEMSNEQFRTAGEWLQFAFGQCKELSQQARAQGVQ